MMILSNVKLTVFAVAAASFLSLCYSGPTYVNPVENVFCNDEHLEFEISSQSSLYNISNRANNGSAAVFFVEFLTAHCSSNDTVTSPAPVLLPYQSSCNVSFTYIYDEPTHQYAAYTNQKIRITPMKTVIPQGYSWIPNAQSVDVQVWCLFPTTAKKSTNGTVHGGGNGGGGGTKPAANDLDMWIEDEIGHNISVGTQVEYGTQLQLVMKLKYDQTSYNATMPTHCTVQNALQDTSQIVFVQQNCPYKTMFNSMKSLEGMGRVSLFEYRMNFTAFTLGQGVTNENLEFICDFNMCIVEDLSRCNDTCWLHPYESPRGKRFANPATAPQSSPIKFLSGVNDGGWDPKRTPFPRFATTLFNGRKQTNLNVIKPSQETTTEPDSNIMYIIYGLFGLLLIGLIFGCCCCMLRFFMMDGWMGGAGTAVNNCNHQHGCHGGCNGHQHIQQPIQQPQFIPVAVPTPSASGQPSVIMPMDAMSLSNGSVRYAQPQLREDDWETSTIGSRRSLVSQSTRGRGEGGHGKYYYS